MRVNLIGYWGRGEDYIEALRAAYKEALAGVGEEVWRRSAETLEGNLQNLSDRLKRESWPMPQDFVDAEWRSESRSSLVGYLRAGKLARAYMGWSDCRFCNKRNGTVEHTDGVWVWPEGLAHYVEAHAVRLPEEFFLHALQNEFQIPRDLKDGDVFVGLPFEHDLSFWASPDSVDSLATRLETAAHKWRG
jgi:hypothetical protein